MKEVERMEKSGEIVLLKDRLNDILLNYDMNLMLKEKIFLKNLLEMKE